MQYYFASHFVHYLNIYATRSFKVGNVSLFCSYTFDKAKATFFSSSVLRSHSSPVFLLFFLFFRYLPLVLQLPLVLSFTLYLSIHYRFVFFTFCFFLYFIFSPYFFYPLFFLSYPSFFSFYLISFIFSSFVSSPFFLLFLISTYFLFAYYFFFVIHIQQRRLVNQAWGLLGNNWHLVLQNWHCQSNWQQKS